MGETLSDDRYRASAPSRAGRTVRGANTTEPGFSARSRQFAEINRAHNARRTIPKAYAFDFRTSGGSHDTQRTEGFKVEGFRRQSFQPGAEVVRQQCRLANRELSGRGGAEMFPPGAVRDGGAQPPSARNAFMVRNRQRGVHDHSTAAIQGNRQRPQQRVAGPSAVQTKVRVRISSSGLRVLVNALAGAADRACSA